MLAGGGAAVKDIPDPGLYRQVVPLRSPRFRASRGAIGKAEADAPMSGFGPATFGRLPDGTAIDGASLGVRAPEVVAVTLPAELVEGCEFVVSGLLHASRGEGSVQLQVSAGKPAPRPGPDPARPV